MIKVGIVDDHAIVAQGFKLLIELQKDLSVVAEYCSFNDALQQLPHQQLDVLIVDVLLPDVSGIELMKHVTAHYPDTRIIALSMYDNEPYISEAIASGALAYMSKRIAPDEIVKSIRCVLNNVSYFSDDVKANMRTQSDSTQLTDREQQVFKLLAKGLTIKETAYQLEMQPKTAHVHKANIYSKLGVNTHQELLKLALVKNVLTVEELTT
ncbi:response regulator [Thalassotalea ganghwensis]